MTHPHNLPRPALARALHAAARMGRMVDVADVEDVVGVAILALRAVVGAVVLAGAAGAGLAAAQSASTPSNAPSPERQATLVRMVRQDCGSCHGMRLTGGLGPALTPQALEGKPLLSMASTIYGGRPGTPMPGWSAMLTQDEAQWVAQQLADGFPEEPRRPAR